MPKVFPSASSVFGLQRTDGKTDWFRIEAKATGPSQVHIYDEIGMWGVSAGAFIAELDAVKGDLEVHLNTPGGEVFDGIAIYNALRKRNPTIVIDALAASIGSVIAMAAAPGRLLMEPTAKLMIHDGFAMAAGNAAELTRMVEQLNDASDTIASVYAARTGKPQAEWRAAMQSETWYTAEAAVAAGLADSIVGVTNHAAPGITNAAPGVITADVSTADDGTQSVAWDPDGDGDDDSTPEGDTDHSHWAADGTQLKPVPGKPLKAGSSSGSDSGQDAGEDLDDASELTNFLVSALRDAAQPHGSMSGTHSHPHPAYGSQGGDTTHDHSHTHDGDAAHSHGHASAAEDHLDLDYSPWNPAQAWHNAALSGDPAAYYAGICAGTRGGDPGSQSSWALPYRYKPGGPANVEGVRAALERLPATDGLTNATQAGRTLRAAEHAADMAKATAQLASAQAAVAALAEAHNVTVTPPAQDPAEPIAAAAEPAIRFGDSVDNTPWNASKAWHNGAASADPAAFYAAICAGKRDGDPATQAAWALPYRYTPSSPPNAAGVKAGLSRLTATDGLTNEAAAKSKLQTLMKAINPDYDPDDLAEAFRSMHNSLNGVK